ncbi:MAG: gluconokinase [Granulosicoccus sp.]|nr:gluconokinase [Granulosicoccus sp.]
MSRNRTPDSPLVVVVMGVSGCGKSTVAQLLGKEISAHFKDGDELHPDSNIRKMASGVPLTDEDRIPWLNEVAAYAQIHAEKHRVCVIACSALKRKYREILNRSGNVAYIFLEGSYSLIKSRMHKRQGHFMPEKLLDSQFAALEDPRAEPNVLTIGIDADPDTVAHQAAKALKASALLPNVQQS